MNLGTKGALLEESKPIKVQLVALFDVEAQLWASQSEMDAGCLVLVTS